MVKVWRCQDCGEIITYGEKCWCASEQIPEEFLTPSQISELQYDGSYEEA